MRKLLLPFSLLVLVGCTSSASKTKSNVAIDQVPEVVMKTARAKEPTIKFDTAIKGNDGVYEIQGKNQAGKVVEVEVKENGEFLKIE